MQFEFDEKESIMKEIQNLIQTYRKQGKHEAATRLEDQLSLLKVGINFCEKKIPYKTYLIFNYISNIYKFTFCMSLAKIC